MSKIQENLYLGDYNDSKNKKFLENAGITHIINLSQLPNSFLGSYEYMTIDIYDSPYSNLIQYFRDTTDFINKALYDGGVVFVHCYAGVSRSATIILAYLLQYMNLNQAYNLVKSKRNIINPNVGFDEQLRRYDNIMSKLRNKYSMFLNEDNDTYETLIAIAYIKGNYVPNDKNKKIHYNSKYINSSEGDNLDLFWF